MKTKLDYISLLLSNVDLIDEISVNLHETLQTKVTITEDNNKLLIENGLFTGNNNNNVFIFNKVEDFQEYDPNDLYYHVISHLEQLRDLILYLQK